MVAISLLLAGGAFAIEKTQAPITTDTTVYVLEIKDTEIQRIDVTAKAGTAAFERAEPFGWKFADSGDMADLSRVSSVVNRLAKLRSSSTVTENVGDLSPYGLAPPVDTALLTLKDGTQHRVVIGNKTPNDAAYFAMVEGKTRLHTINTLLVGDIEKLVADPPVPSPTPNAAATSEAQAAGTPTPTGTPVADRQEPRLDGTPTPAPTIGLPGPSVGT